MAQRAHSSETLITLLVTASIAIGALMVVSAQGKPRVTHSFSAASRGSVATLPELMGLSDLVVEGTIVSQRPHDFEGRTYTLFDLRISRVFKISAKVDVQVTPGNTVQLRRVGGVRERNDKIDVYEAENYPLFSQGDHIISFLRAFKAVPPEPAIGTYFIDATFGPDSVFAIGGGNQVRAVGVSKLSRELSLLNAEALRGRIANPGGAQ